MRTTIVIEGGRISVQVDDQQPLTLPALPAAPAHHESKTAVATAPKTVKSGTDYTPKPTNNTIKKTCVRCHTDFEAPASHGSRKYCDDCRIVLEAKPTASVEKLCMECGNKFTATGTGCHRRKRCDDCKAAIAANPPKASHNAVAARKAPETAPEKATQLEFMPGHEKTPQEIEQWRDMVPSGMPEGPVHHSESKTETEQYVDLWNCAQCRLHSSHMPLCDFHQGMEDAGHKPPKIWPQ